MGRDMPWAKNNKGASGFSWFNDGETEFLCDPTKAKELGYGVGRLKRAWINNGREERQVFKKDVESSIVDNWRQGRLTKKTS